MADKNFKVKSGLQVPSLTTAGPVTTDSSGNVTSSATLPITQGGTGQTSAGNALNALLPLQTSQDNKFLQTNGVTTQWTIPQQQTSTDGTVGYKIYSGTVTPSSPVTGDIWIDQTTGNGIQLVRWRKTIASTTTSLTGLDDNNLTLSYTAGNEQVYINGTLITRGQDYTATNGTSVVLTQAAEVGDTVEIFGNPLFSVTDVYTQAQSNSLYVSKAGFDAAGKNFCINGGMDIWQRGTSFTTDSGGNWSQYTADRWVAYAYYPGYSATQTITQESNLSHVPVGSKYSLKAVLATSHSSINPGRMAINYTLENQNALLLAGKTVTLSFQIKGIGAIDRIQALIAYNPTGGRVSAPMSETQIINQTKSLTSSEFTLVSYTFTVPSQSTLTSSGTIGFTLYYQKSNGTAEQVGDGIYLGNVQLEIGSVVTPFSRSGGDIGSELAACQRYYYTLPYNYNAERVNPYTDFLIMNTADQTSWARGVVQFPVTMRTSPTLQAPTAANYYILGSAGVLSVTSISIDNMTNASMAVVNAYRTSMSTGTTYFLRFAGNVTDYLRFSAEL